MSEETKGVFYLAKHNIKDSVFTNLFKDKKYALQLYQSIHPEDEKVTKDEINVVTLENVLLNNPYNDLGMTVGQRLMIMVEAQSTWSPNIVLRGLMYVVQTIKDYLREDNQSIYKSKKVVFPEPELYVIYTGDRKMHPTELSLSDVYFEGRTCAIDARVKIIYDGQEGDIIYQYVHFTKVYQSMAKKYGRTQKAVMETIRVCKDKDILREYLDNHESEVVDIMMSLFDKEEIIAAYLEDEKKEAIAKGLAEGLAKGRIQNQKEIVAKMSSKGMTPSEIAQLLDIDFNQVNEGLENSNN